MEDVHNISEKCLQRRVIGTIMHGHTPERQCYLVDERFGHDCDVIVSVILRTLDKHEGQLPPTLFLQLDNCTAENKSKLFLAIMAALNVHKLFSEVRRTLGKNSHFFSSKTFSSFFSYYPDLPRLPAGGSHSLRHRSDVFVFPPSPE